MAAVDELAAIVSSGMTSDSKKLGEDTDAAIEEVFGKRYRSNSRHDLRIVLTPGGNNIPFAGLLHPENPASGVYGGMSLIWFPIPEDDGQPASSLLTFVCGTRGLSPDESILGRPGHARHLRGLARMLEREHEVPTWVKRDPTNLGEDVPQITRSMFPRFESVFERYGHFIYAATQIPKERAKARAVLAAFLDMYAWERRWQPLNSAQMEVEEFKNSVRRHLFQTTTISQVNELLRERRFVILQGPPGTGKTRMANELLANQFEGHGQTVQFHPAVTYESFVAGIGPDVTNESLRFRVKPGWLVNAVSESRSRDFVLVIDEVNRGDLGRVLGEAIYLFEPKEIAEGTVRSVRLPQPLEDGTEALEIPKGLYVLGTMNSADRSIAILDLAVRRRFAFVDVWPDIDVVEQQGIELATEAFAKLLDIFTQYAPNDALVLMPGHSYFLAAGERQLSRRLQYELIPLLNEYLLEGRLGPCESQLQAFVDWLESEIARHG